MRKDIIRPTIRRPVAEEKNSICDFFEIVLKHTFLINGIDDLKESLEEEIQDKKRKIDQDFETDGVDRFFLLAEYSGEIIGTVEYGESNELIKKLTDNEFKDILEIGTVFVHPKYQKRGVASLMLYHILQKLSGEGVREVCLDSGYKSAQKIWCKIFGLPAYCFENYWGEDHHMIWKVDVKEALEKLK